VAAVKFREPFDRCLRRQSNTDVPSHAGCVTAFGPWPAGRLACYRIAHKCPTGMRGRAGLLGSGVAWHKRNKAGLKLGALLNTVQGSFPTYHAHIQTHTHTHTQGCAMGLPIWPWHCGLIACPVSGVEWSGVEGRTFVLHFMVM